MPSKIIIICVALIGSCLLAAYFFIPANLITTQTVNDSVLAKDKQLTPSSLSEPHISLVEESKESQAPLSPDASLIELKTELAATILKGESIEETLRIVELKVDALEAQLDDIELRGDNPADVQDETLDSFQAIFAEYQDAIYAFEKNQEKIAWLEDKISEFK